jgi:hypothetical protein
LIGLANSLAAVKKQFPHALGRLLPDAVGRTVWRVVPTIEFVGIGAEAAAKRASSPV